MKKLITFLLLLTTFLFSCTTEMYFNIGIRATPGLSRYTKKIYKKAKKGKPYDVIIVPGIPYDPNTVSSIMQMRILWAKYLYDNGIAKNIIFSGSAVYSPFIESVVMKTIADSLGIPSEHTFSESNAEHSTENVYYSWKMARRMGFKRIALATDPFQSFMLKSFTKKYCPDIVLLPVVVSEVMANKKSLPIINPSAALVHNFISLPERQTFRQRFSGTQGKKVMKEIAHEKWRTSTAVTDYTSQVTEDKGSIHID